MLKDTWIACTATVWDAIAPAEEAPKEIWHYAYDNARKGFVDDFNGKPVYHVLVTTEQREALLTALNTHTPGAAATLSSYEQGTGFDDLEVYHDPADVLSVMPDFVTYDQDGNPISTEPASYDKPNPGFVFNWRNAKIIAGDHDSSHDGDFL